MILKHPKVITQTKEGVLLHITVVPKASRTEIAAIEADYIKIRLAAVPEKGQANTELITFLSKKFKIPKSRIHLIRGETSRQKQILLEGESVQDIHNKLLS